MASTRPAAGKTGTSDNFDYAAFGGYTPDLAGYVSVFNPVDPVKFPMAGVPGSCYAGSAARARCSAPTRPRMSGR